MVSLAFLAGAADRPRPARETEERTLVSDNRLAMFPSELRSAMEGAVGGGGVLGGLGGDSWQTG